MTRLTKPWKNVCGGTTWQIDKPQRGLRNNREFAASQIFARLQRNSGFCFCGFDEHYCDLWHAESLMSWWVRVSWPETALHFEYRKFIFISIILQVQGGMASNPSRVTFDRVASVSVTAQEDHTQYGFMNEYRNVLRAQLTSQTSAFKLCLGLHDVFIALFLVSCANTA